MPPMPNSPSHKAYAASDPSYADYIAETFHTDDPILSDVRERAAEAGMPAIHVSYFDGRHLEVIARAMGARKIVEIGTLAGFSGICLARALTETVEGGRLHTFEYEPRHAEVARESFRRAGVDKKVTIHVGAALDNLPKIESEGPFDLVFIDADKANYANYLAWAHQHLRVGGVALGDNAFAWGLLTAPDNDPRLKEESNRVARQAIGEMNRTLGDPKGPWRGTMLPTGEGLAMGVKLR
jgi:caffeoyl-CoA O-methyltransferase